ncbi:MAG: IS66 family insertion sequence element accessory protein TnpA [Planctomyces sp.]
MGRAIDGVKGREWEERLRRYADSQLTVGDFCVWEGVSVAAFYVWRKKLRGGQRGRRTTGGCGHRRRRVGIDWSTQPRVLPASSCGKKVRGNCGRDDAPSQ